MAWAAGLMGLASVLVIITPSASMASGGTPSGNGDGWEVERRVVTDADLPSDAAGPVLRATIPLCDGIARQAVVWNSVAGCELPEAGVCSYGTDAAAGILYSNLTRASEQDDWRAGDYTCGPPPEGAVVITPEMVAEAFARVDVPASVLQIQPVGGETLVNLDTNFYTQAAPFQASVTLLGQTVEMDIWASSFSWHFGDGSTRTTTTPGAAYPDLQVTHSYTRAGAYLPSLDTTWSAQFRVNGGAWRDVPDSVSVVGATQSLVVREATPVLVD